MVIAFREKFTYNSVCRSTESRDRSVRRLRHDASANDSTCRSMGFHVRDPSSALPTRFIRALRKSWTAFRDGRARAYNVRRTWVRKIHYDNRSRRAWKHLRSPHVTHIYIFFIPCSMIYNSFPSGFSRTETFWHGRRRLSMIVYAIALWTRVTRYYLLYSQPNIINKTRVNVSEFGKRARMIKTLNWWTIWYMYIFQRRNFNANI